MKCYLAQNLQIEDNLEVMKEIKQIGYEVKRALEAGDLEEFSLLQQKHWNLKQQFTQATNSMINHYYQIGIEAGASSGKLCGAGGGGVLMFYCNSKDTVRNVLAREGLREVQFRFSYEGSKIIFESGENKL